MHLTYGESNLSRKHAMYPKEHHHSPLSQSPRQPGQKIYERCKGKKTEGAVRKMCAHLLSGDSVG
jgi:hypothetical protein